MKEQEVGNVLFQVIHEYFSLIFRVWKGVSCLDEMIVGASIEYILQLEKTL